MNYKDHYRISLGLRILILLPSLFFLWGVIGSIFGLIRPFSFVLVLCAFLGSVVFSIGTYLSNVSYSFDDNDIVIHFPFWKRKTVKLIDLSGFYFQPGDNVGSYVFVTENGNKIKINYSGKLGKALSEYVESINSLLEEKGYEIIKKNGICIHGLTKRNIFWIDDVGIQILKSKEVITWNKIKDVEYQNSNGLGIYKLITEKKIAFNDFNVDGNRGIVKFLREKII